MDDIQLLASVAAGDLLSFRDSVRVPRIWMEVEASLWPSGASSDPPDPSDSSDHNDSDDESGDFTSVAFSTAFWGDANIISRAIDGPATINRQGKIEHVEYLDQIPSFFRVPRKKNRIYP
ncbi:hypothetical protein DFH08DRAFT_943911 [Mycena albidolilacea]|uniref:Uncharacterized protein n=1 Tax=Mycena albidolilacea TaxID=1033008 RepID=A0AAD6Z8A7_9AGAR|nr:hypothetical protein DFH08DRAFT_943911 [Mycena albidolilacea]